LKQILLIIIHKGKFKFRSCLSICQTWIVARQFFAPRERGRQLGRNRGELQKNGLKTLESLSRAQNRTPRRGVERHSFGERRPCRAGRIPR
jgi:hypothetical protein